MNSFLFYDIETTGLNPAFDQIVQFAAIRTDMQLKEIDRHVVQVRLRPDIIPSPHAMLTHRVRITDMNSGLHEFEAIREIHRWLNHPGTISIGYNTLNFDDTFLRFSFHRNLLPPYTHQFHNGCTRMDLYPIIIMFWLYRPDILNWPEVDGRPSLKLENLNSSNQWVASPSHDALADTEATLMMARQLIEEKDMWDYLIQFFNKTTDLLRIEKLSATLESLGGIHPKALMVSGEFGLTGFCQAPVLLLGNSIPYGNQTLWLRLDLPELRQTSHDSIEENTWVLRKRLGEPGFILPPLDRFWQGLQDQRIRVAEENVSWLKANPDIFNEIIRYHCEYRYPEIPNVDADAALYQMGFLSKKAQHLCRAFNESDPKNMSKRIDALPNSTLKDLGSRILFRNYPDEVVDLLADSFQKYARSVNPNTENEAMVDYKGNPRRTPKAVLKEIEAIRRENNPSRQDMELLDGLKDYITQRFQS